MSIKKLDKVNFHKWVDKLISSNKVIGVQARIATADRFEFRPLKSASDLHLDYDVTLQPPKIFFQPPCEKLLHFRGQEHYESVLENNPFILIGVHPYDLIALMQMDEIFSKDNYDVHYMTRRNNATIIACDVAKASRDVFASSMGTATADKGYDIILTDVGDGFIAEAATEKGEKLLSMAEDALEADENDLQKRQSIWEHNQKNLNKHKLNCSSSDIPQLLDKAYDHPVFEEKARTCFSCGSCTQVCPTCYCFGVQDEPDWDFKKGERVRFWEGCLLDGFTKVAGDHEFRKNRTDRFRHRIYRKGKYVPAKIGGQIACVGCGRCVGACLPDIANPVKVYNRILEDIEKE